MGFHPRSQSATTERYFLKFDKPPNERFPPLLGMSVLLIRTGFSRRVRIETSLDVRLRVHHTIDSPMSEMGAQAT